MITTTYYRDTLIGSTTPITRGASGNYGWSARVEGGAMHIEIRVLGANTLVPVAKAPRYVLAAIARAMSDAPLAEIVDGTNGGTFGFSH